MGKEGGCCFLKLPSASVWCARLFGLGSGFSPSGAWDFIFLSGAEFPAKGGRGIQVRAIADEECCRSSVEGNCESEHPLMGPRYQTSDLLLFGPLLIKTRALLQPSRDRFPSLAGLQRKLSSP